MQCQPARLAAAILVASAGCLTIDDPHPIAAPGSTATKRWLSELGVFQDLRGQVPIDGFVPFETNLSLWSDGASKRRFVHVPPGEAIHVTDDRWEIPVGAYFMKTFSFPHDARHPEAGEQLIETRFLIRTTAGFDVSTYKWNDDQTDAEVSGGNLNVPINYVDKQGVARSDHFHMPGTSQCEGCHFDRALGLRSPLMDHDGAFTDGTTNQIEHLIGANVLDAVPSQRAPWPDPLDPAAPLELRARAYLATNCGHCHSVDGDSDATSHGVLWDFPNTGPGQLPICKAVVSVNGRNRVIVPGHPEKSEFLARMWSEEPFIRMPRGPTHIPDGAGIAVLTEWVASMPAMECP